MNNSNISHRGSKAADCLEKAWGMIRTQQPCLPEAVVVVFSVAVRSSHLGHFAGAVWRVADGIKGHELAIAPVLFERPNDLLGTLLHEAAHGLLYEWGLKGGCGPDGYYHREEFRNVCRKLGLECEFRNRRYGWNITRLPAAVPDRYLPILELLEREMPWGR